MKGEVKKGTAIDKAEKMFVQMSKVSDEEMLNEKATQFVNWLYKGFDNLTYSKELCLNLLRFFLLKEEDLTCEGAAAEFLTFVVCEFARLKETIWLRMPSELETVCRLDEKDPLVLNVNTFFDCFRRTDFFLQEKTIFQVVAIIRLRFDLDDYFATGGACNWFETLH